MTNLFDFLRDIQKQAVGAWGNAVISEEQWKWLELYLTDSDTEIHFKSNPTGEWKVLDDLTHEMADIYIEHGKQVDGKPAEPVVNLHLGLKGGPDDIFYLLSEAMIQCPNFANIVIGAARFYTEHVPTCQFCGNHHEGGAPSNCPDFENAHVWEFYNRKQQTNETERAADTQRQTGRDSGSDKAATAGQ